MDKGLFADMMGSPRAKPSVVLPGSDDRSDADMQVCQTESQKSRISSARTLASPRQEVLGKVIPGIEEDIRKLKLVVPQLHEEIRDVKRDMQLILAAVRGLQKSTTRRKCQCDCERQARYSGTPQLC